MEAESKDNIRAPGGISRDQAVDNRSPSAPVRVIIGKVCWQLLSPDLIGCLQPVLESPDAFAEIDSSRIYSKPGVVVSRLPASFSDSPRWVLRRTTYARPIARLRDCLRVPGSLRAFRNSLAFRVAGIDTPRVLAAGVARRFWVPIAGYLLMDEIHPKLTLVECLREHGRLPRGATKKIARMIARLHERGFMHGDLTINNILLDGQLDPWLVDLDRARLGGRELGMASAAEDFYRLARHVDSLQAGSRTTALRLLRLYCELRQWQGRERELIKTTVARLHEKVGPPPEPAEQPGRIQ